MPTSMPSQEYLTPDIFSAYIRECKVRLVAVLEKDYESAIAGSRLRFVNRNKKPEKIFRKKQRSGGQRDAIAEAQVDGRIVSQSVDIEIGDAY